MGGLAGMSPLGAAAVKRLCFEVLADVGELVDD